MIPRLCHRQRSRVPWFKTIATALVLLTTLSSCTYMRPVEVGADPTRAREAITPENEGKHVVVELSDGSREEGVLLKAESWGILLGKAGGNPTEIRYAQIEQMKIRETDYPVFVIGTVVVSAVAFMLYVYTHFHWDEGS